MQIESIVSTAKRLCQKRSLDAADALAVRRTIFANDGQINRSEADALFAIERSRSRHCPEWSQVFVEALTDYLIVRQEAASLDPSLQAIVGKVA